MNYIIKRNLNYPTFEFLKKSIEFHNKKYNYYLSPNLSEYKFTHAFFTKNSSHKNIKILGSKLIKNQNDYFLSQIHSCNLVNCSNLSNENVTKADGLISDKKNQNLWVYTADCMPILFADKLTKKVAAIHCGRKGLEKKIIIKLIKNMVDLGSLKKNLLVAIGPSISVSNYLIDKTCYEVFLERFNKKNNAFIKNNMDEVKNINKNELIPLDIKRYAYYQLINENIPCNNIEISNQCTYNNPVEFYSWRREKTSNRQWSFISS